MSSVMADEMSLTRGQAQIICMDGCFWPKADTDSINSAHGLPSACKDVGGPTRVRTTRAMPLDLGPNVLGNLDQVQIRIPHIDRPNGAGRTGAHQRTVHDDLALAFQLRHHFVEGDAGDEAQIQ